MINTGGVTRKYLVVLSTDSLRGFNGRLRPKERVLFIIWKWERATLGWEKKVAGVRAGVRWVDRWEGVGVDDEWVSDILENSIR